MHKICAFMTIIHPEVSMNLSLTDVAVAVEITMHLRNRVDKMERVMVESRSRDSERRNITFLVDAKVAGGAYITRVFSFFTTSITLEQRFPGHQS